jgi:hypothetical protein
LADFLDAVRAKDDLWAYALSERLRAAVGNETPRFWSVTLDRNEAPGLIAAMDGPQPITVADLSKEGASKAARAQDSRSHALILRVLRATVTHELPDPDFELMVGDQLLCAGSAAAEANQQSLLQSPLASAWSLGDRMGPAGRPWRKIARALGLGK